MNDVEYQRAKRTLIEAVRRKDFESANAIRRLILYFYKPNKGTNNEIHSVQTLPKDPCTLGQ